MMLQQGQGCVGWWWGDDAPAGAGVCGVVGDDAIN